MDLIMRSFALLAVGAVFLAALPGRADVEFLWGLTGAAGSPSSLYAINPTNGQVLGLIGATGQVNLSGMAIQPGTGVLYSAQGNVGAKGLYRIDKATGAATKVGTIGVAIADTAFSPAGVLYAWSASAFKLYTINLANGTPTQLANAPSTVGKSSLAFGAGGVLFMVRSDRVITVNPTTGALVTGPVVMTGGSFDNLLAANSAGALYGGARTGKGAPTTIYRLNPATGVVTTVGSAAGVGLTSLIFDTATPPVLNVKGGKKKTTKTSFKLTGNATSLLPLTVSFKSKKAKVKAGKWTLKVPLKKVGKNKITLLCADGMGQSVTRKVTVVREESR
jgi:hypothetical protein